MSTAFTTASKTKKKTSTTLTTTVDLVIRLEVAGSPADVARYRFALGCLADVMRVQAEDGLWMLGYEDAEGGEDEDGHEIENEFVADIESSRVRAVLIDGVDELTKGED